MLDFPAYLLAKPVICPGAARPMERFAHLLLGIWREACRHIQIGESVERVAPLLGHRLPVDLVLILHFDLQRTCAETVAVGSCRPGSVPTRARTECSPQDLERIQPFGGGHSTTRCE